mgnify:CR=1 FL=1
MISHSNKHSKHPTDALLFYTCNVSLHSHIDIQKILRCKKLANILVRSSQQNFINLLFVEFLSYEQKLRYSFSLPPRDISRLNVKYIFNANNEV